MGNSVIGPTPAGWTPASLGGVCLASGGIQTGPFGSQLHASDYVLIGTPIVMPKDIVDNRLNDATIARAAPEDVHRLSRHRLELGDIVYSRRGDVRRRALVRAEHRGWLCGTGCLRARVDPRHADPRFVYYYLGHARVADWIEQHAIGATMANLNTSILAAVPVVAPPLQEQRAIAHVLGTLDDKIELNRRMNETLEEMARAIFKSWFVDFDPVKAKMDGRKPYGMDDETAALFPDSLEDSEIGRIPSGWRVAPVGAIARVKGGKRLPKGSALQETPTSHPYIRVVDFANGRVDERSLLYVPEDVFPEISRYTISANDAYISIAGTVGRVGQVGPSLDGASLTENAAKICDISSDVGRDYMTLALQSERGQSEIRAQTVGSTQPKLALFRIRSIPLLVPPAAAASAMQEAVGPLLRRVQANLDESRTLGDIRDALLPRLISGELDVRELTDLPVEAT